MAQRLILSLVIATVVAAGAAIYRVETRRAPVAAAAAEPAAGIAEAEGNKTGTGEAISSGEAPARNSGSRPVSPVSKKDGGRTEKPAANDAPASPLRAGEVLEYTASVSKLSNVANLKLQIADQRNFLGRAAWHFAAFAHTQNPLRMMFALDDQFDSYADAANLISLQYEMHLNERGQQVNSVQRMTVSGKEPASGGASETRVLPGTRDPLGMMQYLRTVDWSKTSEVRGPVYDGHKLYDARASLQGTESVSVPAGSYRASKIAIRVFENGAQLKDASFALYLAQNSSRTPVLLEAVMPWANARVELLKAP